MILPLAVTGRFPGKLRATGAVLLIDIAATNPLRFRHHGIILPMPSRKEG